MTNILSSYYKNQESEWDKLINRRYPESECVRWSPQHRVYKYKKNIIKIQYKINQTIPYNQTLKNEYNILSLLANENDIYQVNYEEIKNWELMEIKFYETETLQEYFFYKRTISFKLFISLLKEILFLIRKNINYKQLRPKHTFVFDSSKVAFIDFGGSSIQKKSDVIVAMIFKTFHYFIHVLKHFFNKEHYRKSIKNNYKWENNKKRKKDMLPAALMSKFIDKQITKNISKMEEVLFRIYELHPELRRDSYFLQLDKYVLFGEKDANLLWDRIKSKLNVKNKSIVDVEPGLAIFSIFSKINGAERIKIIQENKMLNIASLCLGKAFGIDNLITSDSFEKDNSDICFWISSDFDKGNDSDNLKIITKFNEVAFQTKNIKYYKSAIEKMKYNILDCFRLDNLADYILIAKK